MVKKVISSQSKEIKYHCERCNEEFIYSKFAKEHEFWCGNTYEKPTVLNCLICLKPIEFNGPKTRNCEKCNTKYTADTKGEINLDTWDCSNCKGIFYDQNEILNHREKCEILTICKNESINLFKKYNAKLRNLTNKNLHDLKEIELDGGRIVNLMEKQFKELEINFNNYKDSLPKILPNIKQSVNLGSYDGNEKLESQRDKWKNEAIEAIEIDLQELREYEDKIIRHYNLARKYKEAKSREEALDYKAAIDIWESLDEIKEAARLRRLESEMGSVKVAQSIVQGDQITEVKDSVINESNIGSSIDDKFAKLEKLTKMKKEGLIDDDEFKQMKKEILGK